MGVVALGAVSVTFFLRWHRRGRPGARARRTPRGRPVAARQAGRETRHRCSSAQARSPPRSSPPASSCSCSSCWTASSACRPAPRVATAQKSRVTCGSRRGGSDLTTRSSNATRGDRSRRAGERETYLDSVSGAACPSRATPCAHKGPRLGCWNRTRPCFGHAIVARLRTPATPIHSFEGPCGIDQRPARGRRPSPGSRVAGMATRRAASRLATRLRAVRDVPAPPSARYLDVFDRVGVCETRALYDDRRASARGAGPLPVDSPRRVLRAHRAFPRHPAKHARGRFPSPGARARARPPPPPRGQSRRRPRRRRRRQRRPSRPS